MKNEKLKAILEEGLKQIENASICIECAKLLREKGYFVTEKACQEGLKSVVHKARFEKT